MDTHSLMRARSSQHLILSVCADTKIIFQQANIDCNFIMVNGKTMRVCGVRVYDFATGEEAVVRTHLVRFAVKWKYVSTGA